MPNLYGVANPIPIPAFGNLIGAADIVCPAGTETNVIALTLPQPAVVGNYIPVGFIYIHALCGATAPTFVGVSMRFGSGADFFQSQFPPFQLAANANLVTSLYGVGISTIVQNPTGNTILNWTILAVTQPVTAKFDFSYAFAWWLRGPD